MICLPHSCACHCLYFNVFNLLFSEKSIVCFPSFFPSFLIPQFHLKTLYKSDIRAINFIPRWWWWHQQSEREWWKEDLVAAAVITTIVSLFMAFYSSSFFLFLFTFVSFFHAHNNKNNNNNNNNNERPRRNSLLNSFYCYIEIFIYFFFSVCGFSREKFLLAHFIHDIFFRMFLMDGSLCIFTIFGVHNFAVCLRSLSLAKWG